jgi:hypothetical protein
MSTAQLTSIVNCHALTWHAAQCCGNALVRTFSFLGTMRNVLSAAAWNRLRQGVEARAVDEVEEEQSVQLFVVPELGAY